MGQMNAARRAARIIDSESNPEAYPNPFVNDPFALVWTAFKNLYPDKECKVFYDQHQGDQHDEEYGFAHFPDDGSTPSVFIYAEHSINTQVETFAHELAHVAVGPDHEHDDVWEAAFDAIFQEYNRIGDELFGKPEEADDPGHRRNPNGSAPEGILLFGERHKLAVAFAEWAEQNGAAQVPENVIAYFLIKGLLDVPKCLCLISKREEERE